MFCVTSTNQILWDKAINAAGILFNKQKSEWASKIKDDPEIKDIITTSTVEETDKVKIKKKLHKFHRVLLVQGIIACQPNITMNFWLLSRKKRSERIVIQVLLRRMPSRGKNWHPYLKNSKILLAVGK